MKVYVLTEDVDDGRCGGITFVRGVYTDYIKAMQDGMLLDGFTDVVEMELNEEVKS